MWVFRASSEWNMSWEMGIMYLDAESSSSCSMGRLGVPLSPQCDMLIGHIAKVYMTAVVSSEPSVPNKRGSSRTVGDTDIPLEENRIKEKGVVALP